jgi:hypothetical protein
MGGEAAASAPSLARLFIRFGKWFKSRRLKRVAFPPESAEQCFLDPYGTAVTLYVCN